MVSEVNNSADEAVEEAVKIKDRIRRWFQENTPAPVVNNAVRINSVVRGFGDFLNIGSGIKAMQAGGGYARIRAGAVSGFGSVIGTVYEQKEQSQETIDEYNRMSTPEYAWTRMKQIFQPQDHLTQTVGATIAANGLWTVESGVRFLTKEYSAAEIARSAHQSEMTIPFVHSRFKWKPTVLRKGMLETVRGGWTLIGASALIFAKNEADAWQVFTSVMTGRTAVTVAQGVESKAKDNDSFNGAYTATTLFANGVGFLYGGVKKEEDGTIVEVRNDKTEKPLKYQAIVEEQESNVPQRHVEAETGELLQREQHVEGAHVA